MPPARWLIATVLLLVFVTATLVVTFAVMTALRRREVSPA
jgi:hypothetical protein